MDGKAFRDFVKRFEGLARHVDKNTSAAIRMAADMAASDAKRTHTYKDRSGALTSSIAPDGPRGSFRTNTLEAIVSAGAGYGVFVEKGTRAHTIRPKHRKALRWTSPAGFVFSRKGVKHPGTKPYRFLENAVNRTTPKLVRDLIPQAIELSFVQCGFKRGK